MKHEPNIAAIAALIGDPARANILAALLDGRALTLSELAISADVGLPTASAHVSKLEDAKLVVSVKQGRNRYARLTGEDVAQNARKLDAAGCPDRAQARPNRTARPGAARGTNLLWPPCWHTRCSNAAKHADPRHFGPNRHGRWN